MPELLALLPLSIIAVSILVLRQAAVRYLRRRKLLRVGIVAGGTCVHRTVTRSSSGDEEDPTVHETRHHLIEFRTREGQVVRFVETRGDVSFTEGDTVTVRYLPNKPSVAMAVRPSPH